MQVGEKPGKDIIEVKALKQNVMLSLSKHLYHAARVTSSTVR
jgi:hypothetical protein